MSPEKYKNMKNIFIILILIPFFASAQSESVKQLHKNLKLTNGYVSMSVSGGLLRFVTRFSDIENAKELRRAAKDIKSVKVYTFPINTSNFTEIDVKNLKNQVKEEAFEELMVVKDGINNTVDILIKEKNGDIISTLFFIEEPQNLVVLDLIGKIDLADIYKLVKEMENQ